MMRILKIAALAAVMVLPTTSVQASVLGGLVTRDAIPDLLVDDSAAFVLDRGGDAGVLEIGDLLVGTFHLDTVEGAAVPVGSSIFGVFSFEVASISPGATGQSVFFTAPTAAADNVVTLLSGGGVDVSGLSGAPIASTALAIIESSTVDITSNDLDAGTMFSDFGSAFDAILTFGFDGLDDHQIVTARPTVDVTDLAGIGPSFIPVALADFATTLSLTDRAFFDGLDLLPVVNPITGAEGDLVGLGSISTPSLIADGNGFLFTDDGTFLINAVPEATSVAVWGLLATIGSYFGGFRRRNIA